MRAIVAVLLVAAFATPSAAQLRTRVYASGFTNPAQFVQDPTDRAVQFVVERGGRIRVLVNGVVQTRDFLDLSGIVSTNTPEQGLISLAFPPATASTSRYLFVSFTDVSGNLVVSRFIRASTRVVSPGSRTDFMWQSTRYLPEPSGTHIGGHLAFDPLYGGLTIGLGDGGVASNASDDSTFLGKLFQLGEEPDTVRTPRWDRFTLTGINNVRRFSYDKVKQPRGHLFLAYSDATAERMCRTGYPLWSYTQSRDTIVGGSVYRGRKLGAPFYGRYFYADIALGGVWSYDMRPQAVDIRNHSSELGTSPSRAVVSFGTDADSELYLVTTDGLVLAVDGIGAPRPGVTADVDRDDRSDLVIWRASTGTWYTANTASNYTSGFMKQFGSQSLGDVPMTGDVDGDGKADFIVWRASTGTWYWVTSSSAYTDGSMKQFGNQSLGDQPFIADFDGDSKADFAVWRASTGTWYWTTSSSGYRNGASKQFGSQGLGDVPLVGDLDGDNKTDLIVWRASTATWYWVTSSSGYAAGRSLAFGDASVVQRPLVADIDGDHKVDLILWGEAGFIGDAWQWRTSASGYASGGASIWGSLALGDVPLVGDVDGDGFADFVIWRPGDGGWYIQPTTGVGPPSHPTYPSYPGMETIYFGNASLGDRPIMK